jgi:hypothetical protein
MLVKAKTKKFWTPELIMPIGGKAAAIGGPPYTYQNSFSTGSGVSGDTISTTIDIGTAQADRLIVVVTASQNSKVLTTVVVNGVTLTNDIVGNGAAISSGLVTAGSGPQTVNATWTGSGFNQRGFSVFRLTGLSSNTVKNTTSTTISVTGGDLMFSGAYGTGASGGTWASSTQAPAAFRDMFLGASLWLSSADWTIAATNASFTLNVTGPGSAAQVAATYR